MFLANPKTTQEADLVKQFYIFMDITKDELLKRHVTLPKPKNIKVSNSRVLKL